MTKDKESNQLHDEEFDDDFFNIQELILSTFNMSNSFESKGEKKSNKFLNQEMKDTNLIKKNHYMVFNINIKFYILFNPNIIFY